eukprot:CCRYP_002541-RA/>CCRYP_002541-RA protein AED:0.00 eAED:0.00 QI:97/1/1/1/0/0/2/37/77
MTSQMILSALTCSILLFPARPSKETRSADGVNTVNNSASELDFHLFLLELWEISFFFRLTWPVTHFFGFHFNIILTL